MKKIKLNLDELEVESFSTSLKDFDLHAPGGGDAQTNSLTPTWSWISGSVVSATVTWALSCEEYTCDLTQRCVTTDCQTIQATGCDGDCTLVC